MEIPVSDNTSIQYIIECKSHITNIFYRVELDLNFIS